MKTLRNVLNGVLMGVANVIPGVSGGTIAVVLGFYDELMNCITLNLKVIKEHFMFLLTLGIGVVIGVVGLSHLMEILFNTFPQQTYFSFIGIILGSLPLVFTKARIKNPKLTMSSYVGFAVALLVMIVMAFLNVDSESGSVLYTTLTPESFVMCTIAMAIAVSTMIIPGISGSMILIVMNMYQTIYFEVLNKMNIPLLLPCAIGGVIGLFGGAILIRFLLAKYNQFTYMVIVGLLVGSIIQLIVQANIVAFDLGLIISVVIMLVVMFGFYKMSESEYKRDLELVNKK